MHLTTPLVPQFCPAYQIVIKGFSQIQVTNSTHLNNSSNSSKLSTNSIAVPNFYLAMFLWEYEESHKPSPKKNAHGCLWTPGEQSPLWKVRVHTMTVHYRPVLANTMWATYAIFSFLVAQKGQKAKTQRILKIHFT